MLGGINPLMMGGGGAAAVRPQDAFAIALYTGNSGTQSIVNGLNLSATGGLTWLKVRSVTGSHYLYDTLRGAGNVLSTNATAGASTREAFASFNSNGFTVNVGGGSALNNSGDTYLSISFLETAGFFTKNSITHTNGVATVVSLTALDSVGMCSVKRTNGSGDWIIIHNSLTAGNNLRMTTAAQTTTDAWLSVSGTSLTVSASAPTGIYIVYGWAHAPSSIQCGSFTTNGSGTGTFASGWANGSQFVMLKCITTTGSWEMLDTARTPSFSGDDAILLAQAMSGESTAARVSQSSGTLSFTGLSASQTYAITAIRAPV